jgi:hypothetical protein
MHCLKMTQTDSGSLLNYSKLATKCDPVTTSRYGGVYRSRLRMMVACAVLTSEVASSSERRSLRSSTSRWRLRMQLHVSCSTVADGTCAKTCIISFVYCSEPKHTLALELSTCFHTLSLVQRRASGSNAWSLATRSLICSSLIRDAPPEALDRGLLLDILYTGLAIGGCSGWDSRTRCRGHK